jgi:hypothetical protein
MRQHLVVIAGAALLAGCAGKKPAAEPAAVWQPEWRRPVVELEIDVPRGERQLPAPAVPQWLYEPGTDRASACAPMTAGPDAYRVAVAKAQAELVRRRQVRMRSDFEMTTESTRSGAHGSARSAWNERLEQRAQGVLEHIEVLLVETVHWDGRPQICVWIAAGATQSEEVENE